MRIAEKRRRVHSFVFATRLTNISRELTSRDPDEALARASASAQDWEGGTRIAHALHDFNRLWSRRVLGQGAIVLLFTDGLERQVTTELTFEMDRLKRSCRRLVWLNPLLRFDAFEARASGIRAMLPHVARIPPHPQPRLDGGALQRIVGQARCPLRHSGAAKRSPEPITASVPGNIANRACASLHRQRLWVPGPRLRRAPG